MHCPNSEILSKIQIQIKSREKHARARETDKEREGRQGGGERRGGGRGGEGGRERGGGGGEREGREGRAMTRKMPSKLRGMCEAVEGLKNAALVFLTYIPQYYRLAPKQPHSAEHVGGISKTTKQRKQERKEWGGGSHGREN